MIESKLNKSDRERISVDIKLTLILGTALVVFLIVLIGLIPLGLFLFGHPPTDGSIKRGTFILLLIGLAFVALTRKNLIKYFDLRTGKKIKFKTTDYEIRKEKDGLFLLTKSPMKLRLNLYDDLMSLLKQTDPLTIEISKWSKTLLFISHDTENLMEKIEKEND